MKAGLVQLNQIWESKNENKIKIDSLLSKYAEDFSFLIFPELTLTGFTMQPEKFAEDTEGETFRYFSGIASGKKADVFAGFIERFGSGYSNSLMHISSEGKLKAIYRKMHPFSFSGEDRHYKAGGEIITTEIGGFRAGLAICYDLRFPELFRLYAKENADIIIIIANWPVARIHHWKTLLAARAIENQCFIAGVNRTGSDPELQYNGNSALINPMGEILCQSEGEEKILIQDFDAAESCKVKEKLPFLKDIRLI